MAIIQYGTIIRKYREEMGVTQEELCEGICSVPTLSRIENGERMPTKDNLTRLLQRLGKTDLFIDSYVSANDFELHELKYNIRQMQMLGDREKGKQLLEKYKSLHKKDSVTNRQFELTHEILFYPEKYSTEDMLEKLEACLRQTCSSYTKDHIPRLLTYEEILLLNSIAHCYSRLGDAETAIRIYYKLIEYYERHMVNSEEILRTKPLILYNAANELCAVERYDECISCCDKGILLAQETGRCFMLPYILYVRGWALILSNNEENAAEAKKTMLQAIHTADFMNNAFVMREGRDSFKENFGEDIPESALHISSRQDK